jgi:membrane-associated phospholipid phosphatase
VSSGRQGYEHRPPWRHRLRLAGRYSQAMCAEVSSAVRQAHSRASGVGKLLGKAPLVPDRLRRWVVVVTVVAVACVAGFGFYVRGSDRPVLFDRSADGALVRTSGLEHHVAVVLSDVGDPKIFVSITALVVIVLVILRDYRAAVAAVAAVATAVVLVEEVFKPFFGRHYGGLPGPTFPSGHTAVAMALAGVVVLAANRHRPLGRLLGPIWCYVLMAVVLVVAAMIGVAMVMLQLHYMTDVVTGVPLGLAVAGCTGLWLDAIANHLLPARGAEVLRSA